MRAIFLATTMLAAVCGTAPALAQAVAAPGAAAAPAAAAAAASPDAATLALAPIPRGELTDAAAPKAYRIDLTIDPSKERFSGHTEIDAALTRPARFVDLHGKDLHVTRATAAAGGRVWTGTWSQIEASGVARLTFPDMLPAGPVTLAFDYDAPFQNGPSGNFHVHVGDDWYSWTQHESIDARATYPSFDEPGFKTPFTVTLRTLPGQRAISNAPELALTRENGLDVHHFAPTLPLPSYLVAMMVGPFVSVEGTVPANAQRATPLPLRIVSTKGNADKLAFALENSKQIVGHLENYFGQAFPFPKLDQITSPIMPGAMENAGADLYADSLIVLDDSAPTSQKRAFGMVVAHELSHQWFGDMVSPAWWEDIWLNESFANWMGFRIGNEWRPELKIGAGGLGEGFNAMRTDALIAGRPIHEPIPTNDRIDAAFDTITYGKGGHVIAMIAAFMGDDKFRDGVRRYMAAHRYGNASSAQFFGAMAEASGDARIVPAMQSFTDQQGVPLLTVSGTAGKYTLTQSRYVRLGTAAQTTRWGIPVCMRRGTVRDCRLMTGDAMPMTLGGSGALMPNAGGTGYYRFELPKAGWDALIAGASSLRGSEATAVDDSLYASFQAGRASAVQMITLARGLAANPDSVASEDAFSNLMGLARGGFLTPAADAAFKRLREQTYRPRLAAYGFNPRAGAYAGDDTDRLDGRALVVAQLADAKDPAITAQLLTAADAYLGGDRQALDTNYLRLALKAYIDRGKLPAAKVLVERALSSQDPVFRPVALGTVAGSGNNDIAAWLLTGFSDPRLRLSERLQVVGGVVQTGETRDYGYGWVKANSAALMQGGGNIFAARLPGVLGGFCSAAKSAEIAADFRALFAGTAAALELERTIERVRDCGILKDARGAELSAAMIAAK